MSGVVNFYSAFAYSELKHIATEKALCIDDASSNEIDGFSKELTRRRLALTQTCAKIDMTCTHNITLHNQQYVAFVATLRTCAANKDLCRGIQTHDDILKSGLLQQCLDALVNMYAKCGALGKAKDLLDRHRCKNVLAWNALIAGYVRQGQAHHALKCFEQMQHEGLHPNEVTFACILRACGSIKAIDKGKQIHDEIVRRGLLEDDIILGNALVDMYVKCGALAKAQGVLIRLPSRDVISWNSLITGYAQQGQGIEALNCYEQMQCEGLSPDAVTYICVLKACGSLQAADKGEQIHDEITRRGLLGKDIVLGTALVDMYAKCGALAKARAVLSELPSRNVVTWNALITGYCQLGQGKEALVCYEQMQQEGLSPSAVTFSSILKACGCLGAASKGEQIHEEIARQGLLQNNVVIGTALVDMYVKCGALEKAARVLDELTSRDAVAWNSVIAGYAHEGQGEQALECFERMQEEGLSPSVITLTCVLKACGSIGAADKGKQIHDEIVRQGLLHHDVALGSALVDMYAKCGALAMAQQALEELPSQDVVCWNALIAGYSHKGESEQVVNCFRRMQHKGLSPNAVTFSCVLNAFSHRGLIEDSNMYFMTMSTTYGIIPELEHYTCIVDMYGRAGHLYKAMKVIQKMPSSCCSEVWSALLGACRKWGNVNVGRWAYEQAMKVEKNDAVAYVLMADTYAVAGMYEYAKCLEAIRPELLLVE